MASPGATAAALLDNGGADRRRVCVVAALTQFHDGHEVPDGGRQVLHSTSVLSACSTRRASSSSRRGRRSASGRPSGDFSARLPPHPARCKYGARDVRPDQRRRPSVADGQAGVDDVELAERCNTSPDVVEEWPEGERQPTMTQFQQLVARLRRPVPCSGSPTAVAAPASALHPKEARDLRRRFRRRSHPGSGPRTGRKRWPLTTYCVRAQMDISPSMLRVPQGAAIAHPAADSFRDMYY